MKGKRGGGGLPQFYANIPCDILLLFFRFFYTIFFIKDDNHTSTTAVVAQWVRTLVPQAEGWVFES